MRVVVMGGRGMLGTAVCTALTAMGHRVLPLGSNEANITDYAACRKAILGYKPELIVNCAALTDVDGCERDPDSAFRINSVGAQNVAGCAEEASAKLVYVSTDFVFDGNKTDPYTEFDTTNPLGAYGASKLAGEKLSSDACARTYIVRTSWLYGVAGKCFPKTILRLAQSRPSFNIVADQTGCPTYVVDLASAIGDIVDTPRYGLYHVANAGEATWHEFAQAILQESDITNATINPISASEWSSPTTRPSYSALRGYVRELQGKPALRHWKDALAAFVAAGIPE